MMDTIRILDNGKDSGAESEVQVQSNAKDNLVQLVNLTLHYNSKGNTKWST